MILLGIIRGGGGVGWLRGGGFRFLASRICSGIRLGLGGKGREVCVHVGGLWGRD